MRSSSVLAENCFFRDAVKSFIQGFLPGIVLKLFLANLPKILMAMSKIEGVTSLSSLERSSAAKYHLFLLVNVFLGSVITGAAFEQLDKFLNQTATEYEVFFSRNMKHQLLTTRACFCNFV